MQILNVIELSGNYKKPSQSHSIEKDSKKHALQQLHQDVETKSAT